MLWFIQIVSKLLKRSMKQFSYNKGDTYVNIFFSGMDGYKLAIVLSNVTAESSQSYYPRFGGELFPKNVRVAIIDGDFAPVEVLIGSNNGDGSTLITKSMKDVFGFFGEKNPQINYTFGKSIIKSQFENFPDPDAVVERYLGNVQEDDCEEIRFKVKLFSGNYYSRIRL